MMRVRIICPGCRGRGTVTSYSCPACAHGRRAMGPALMKAIPAGCEDGRVWRVAGGGHRGQNGGPNGDPVIEVRIRPHPIFSRSGSDLTCPGRSEEHTSELQSRMRSSYDVFCLKKKR